MAKSSPEAMLISSIVRSQNHLPVISSGLDLEMFHAYPDEWEWITQYVTRHRRAPSKRAIKDRFPSFSIYVVDDVEHYVDEVKKAHIRHELIETIDKTASQLQMGDDPIRVLEQVGNSVQHLALQRHGASPEIDLITNWQSVYQDALRRVIRTQEQGSPGIPTGFDTLDVATGGIQPGHLWVVAARLGVGKTWSAIKMAVTAMSKGYTPLYFSLEQSKASIGFRTHTFLSALYNGRGDVFRNLDLNMGENFSLLEYKRFLRNLSKYVKSGFFVNDTTRGRITPAHMATQIEAVHPDLVIVDYLTLMARESGDWQAVAKLIGDIKSVAEKYQMPTIVISQINRAGVGKEPPGTENLSQSDSVGQDADAVITLTRVSDHVVKFKLTKYRHGIDGHTWYAEFDVNNGIYREISGDEAERIKHLDTEKP